MDICGSINLISNGKKKYFISFIDDYCWNTCVYFLPIKSKAFVVFKSLKAQIENKVGKTIESLYNDRDGEYMSQELLIFVRKIV